VLYSKIYFLTPFIIILFTVADTMCTLVGMVCTVVGTMCAVVGTIHTVADTMSTVVLNAAQLLQCALNVVLALFKTF